MRKIPPLVGMTRKGGLWCTHSLFPSAGRLARSEWRTLNDFADYLQPPLSSSENIYRSYEACFLSELDF